MRAFHVTPKKNLTSILKNGLLPQIGERSSQLNPDGIQLESVPRVYLFPTRNDCDTALYQWLGEQFEDLDDDLVFIEVSTKGLEIESDCEFEISTRKAINPVRITNVYDELWSEISFSHLRASNESTCSQY